VNKILQQKLKITYLWNEMRNKMDSSNKQSKEDWICRLEKM